MFEQLSFNNNVTGVKINRILLAESGTYNPMFHRPYVTNSSSLADVIDSLERQFNNSSINTSTNVLPEMLAQSTGAVVAPVAVPVAEAIIPNNWSEKRVMFILEADVEYSVGTIARTVYQGFSNYLGVSHRGNIDEEMDFYINSYTILIPTYTVGNFGKQVTYRISESGRVVSTFERYNPYEGDSLTLVRPFDVFVGCKNAMYDLPAHHLIDGRTMALPGVARVSTRRNDVPSNYLSRVLDGYRRAMLRTDFTSNNHYLIDAAVANTTESTLETNPFIRQIMSVKTHGSATSFKYKDLLALDPSLPARTTFARNSGARLKDMHQVGTSQGWHGYDRETQMATILANAVPSIMMDNLIGRMSFFSTNDNTLSQHITTIIGMDGVVDADLTQNAQLFIQRMASEVLQDISYGSQVRYHISVDASIMGETNIHISLEGKPAVPFTLPSFCDSLISPVVSNQHYQQIITHDLGILVEQVIGGLSTATAPKSTPHSGLGGILNV